MALGNNILQGMEQMLPDALARFGVAGLAMTVIQDETGDNIRAIGLKNISTRAAVTTRTLFPIGSLTKTFLSAALGILVDNKTMSWDAPVRAYIPEFRMFDVDASKMVTPRDLMNMTTGFSDHDILRYRSDISVSEVVERLKYLEPACPFRSQWKYSNINYYVAAEIIGRITGLSWDAFIESEILRPLGMTDTVFSQGQAREKKDYVTGYRLENGECVRCCSHAMDLCRLSPSGSMCSSVRDINLWVRLFLQGGSLDGARILSPETHAEMTSPTTPTRLPDRLEGYYPEFYGSWGARNYRGYKMVYHQGSQYGFRAFICFIPERKAGVAVLANQHDSLLPHALSYLALDRILGLEPFAWDRYLQWYDQNLPKPQKKRSRKSIPVTKREATRYVGEYSHPGYGKITVLCQKNSLGIEYNGYLASIRRTMKDSWEVKFAEWPTMSVRFKTNSQGVVENLYCPMDHPKGKEVKFVRIS